ncbi:MAG: RNA polymerase sigma factor [Bacteroidetes bacterium]|nr:RNA polymerase sigma factor [Bacteroidota bacterium]
MTIAEFATEFETVRSPLKSYLLRITASIEDAEDIIQDTFIKASEKLNTFRGESSLKTWLFTISSNMAKDNLRAQKRWPENVTDICKTEALASPDYFHSMTQIQQSSPQGKFELRENIMFCFTCVAKSLPLEQQICVLLKEVYDFKVSEISIIMDTTEAMVKYYLHMGRGKLVKVFDNRCALINKQGACNQCSELNGLFNPQQNFEVEKNKIEMARVAERGDKEHLLDLRLRIMSEINPFDSPGSQLQLFHLQFNKKVMEKK